VPGGTNGSEELKNSREPLAPYLHRLWAPFRAYHLYNNVSNVIWDLYCCKQTVYRVSESAFFLLFSPGQWELL